MNTKKLVVGQMITVENVRQHRSFETKVVKVNPLGTVFTENNEGHFGRFDANGHGGEDELEGGRWEIVDPDEKKEG